MLCPDNKQLPNQNQLVVYGSPSTINEMSSTQNSFQLLGVRPPKAYHNREQTTNQIKHRNKETNKQSHVLG